METRKSLMLRMININAITINTYLLLVQALERVEMKYCELMKLSNETTQIHKTYHTIYPYFLFECEQGGFERH
jgi:hypothetical protein